MPYIQKYPTPAAFMVASSHAWCSSNHTGLCTVPSFLPPNCTSLPHTGNPGELLKWQLRCLHKSSAHISMCCCAVVRYNLSGTHALHKLRGVYVWATLGTLRCSSRPEESVCGLWLARGFLYGLFLCELFVTLYVTADL